MVKYYIILLKNQLKKQNIILASKANNKLEEKPVSYTHLDVYKRQG